MRLLVPSKEGGHSVSGWTTLTAQPLPITRPCQLDVLQNPQRTDTEETPSKHMVPGEVFNHQKHFRMGKKSQVRWEGGEVITILHPEKAEVHSYLQML